MTRRQMLRTILAATISLPMLHCTGAEAHHKQADDISIEMPESDLVSPTEIGSHTSTLQEQCSGALSFFNMVTHESIVVQYLAKNGEPDPEACGLLSGFFKSSHDGEGIPIHEDLFMLLDAVRSRLGATERNYLLFSGYRSPAYNRLLRESGVPAAQDSYHVKGMAADIALEGVLLRDIDAMAKDLGMGGVGRYTKFVHLDVGPVRCWRS